MMQEFEKMVKFRKKVIPNSEMIKITKIVIAGNLSRKIHINFIRPKL